MLERNDGINTSGDKNTEGNLSVIFRKMCRKETVRSYRKEKCARTAQLLHWDSLKNELRPYSLSAEIEKGRGGIWSMWKRNYDRNTQGDKKIEGYLSEIIRKCVVQRGNVCGKETTARTAQPLLWVSLQNAHRPFLPREERLCRPCRPSTRSSNGGNRRSTAPHLLRRTLAACTTRGEHYSRIGIETQLQ